MQVYLTRVAEIVNQIRSLGEVIEEKKIVQKVLRSLPPKYDYIVAAIEESKDLSAYTLHDLTCSLQVHEERIGRSSNQPLEEAFGSINFSNPKQQESKGKFRGQTFQNNDRPFQGRGGYQSRNSSLYCKICKKTNHNTNECYFKCKNCENSNHSQRDCYHQKKEGKQNEAHFSEDEGEQLLSCMIPQHQSQETLYMDNDCSSHMRKNIIFDETTSWNWEDESVEHLSLVDYKSSNVDDEEDRGVPPPQSPNTPQSPPDQVADSSPESPIRKTSSLREINEGSEFALYTSEPGNFEVANNKEIWRKAMEEEISMIENNNTWELVNRPIHKDVIGLKWIYKTKYQEDGSIQKHKARLVANGYSQQLEIDFIETFAPVVRMETIRIVLALASQLELKYFNSMSSQLF